jgi:transcriptional regulator with XRE-family HTH domain
MPVTQLSPAQCRAARALLDWHQRELTRRSKVSQKTIADFERGRTTPWVRTLDDLREAFEEAGLRFIDAEGGVTGSGVAFKEGAEAAKTGDTQGATTGQGDDTGALDALGWDDWPEAGDASEDDEPLPPLDWSDEDKADQIEHWRSRPEAWAKLHEVSRQCLLRAMGVERL